MSDFSWSKDTKARKEWACETCETKINKGELYWYTRGLYDGYWWSCRYCMECRAAYYDAFLFGSCPADEIGCGSELFNFHQQESQYDDAHPKIKENWEKMKDRREKARG